jgi:RNA polymerase sigma factor (sigma-70 family)
MQNNQPFIDIIKENEGLIYKIAKTYSDSKQDEQDLYQEIVYQLWKSFTSFRNESKLSTWMYRIGLNTSIGWLNKEKKNRLLAIPKEAFNKPEESDGIKEERTKMLYDQIKKLNTIDKGVILLYLEGNNYEEIASITGFTATNVGTRLGRIKQKLSSQINK